MRGERSWEKNKRGPASPAGARPDKAQTGELARRSGPRGSAANQRRELPSIRPKLRGRSFKDRPRSGRPFVVVDRIVGCR